MLFHRGISQSSYMNLAPRCSSSGHLRRQPWVLQADGPSLKIRVSNPYRWQGSGQRCHPPSHKSLQFLPHSAKVWGCHPVRWNLNARRSRMLPVCCQSRGLRLIVCTCVYQHLMLYLIAGHQSLFNFEIGMFSLLEQLQACQLIFHPKHPNEYVHHAYSTCMILVYFVAAYVT